MQNLFPTIARNDFLWSSLFYSSRTGNTKKVANGIFAGIPGDSKDIQSLEEYEGKDADICIINLKTEAFVPLNDIYKHLVYCEDGSDVETVICAGRILMENRRLLNVDETALLDELQEMTKEFKERYEKTVKDNEVLLPYVHNIYEKCISQFKDCTCNLFV